MVSQEKRGPGRPRKPPARLRRAHLAFRVTDWMRDELAAWAAEAGRSMSEEIEYRLAFSLQEEARYFHTTARARRAIWGWLRHLDWLQNDDDWNPGWELSRIATLREEALLGLLTEVLKLARDREIEPSYIAAGRALLEQIEAQNNADRDHWDRTLAERAVRIADAGSVDDEPAAVELIEEMEARDRADRAATIKPRAPSKRQPAKKRGKGDEPNV